MASQSRSETAFEILVRQHHRRLLAYAISITKDRHAAPDIVQDSFVTAYQKLDQFDTTRDFGAWMRGIVRNKCREWMRSLKYVSMDEDLLEALEQKHRQWDEQEAGKDVDILKALQDCLTNLPDFMEKAINLFYFRQLTGAEVASQLGIGQATVRKRLQRARVQLGECIKRRV